MMSEIENKPIEASEKDSQEEVVATETPEAEFDSEDVEAASQEHVIDEDSEQMGLMEDEEDSDEGLEFVDSFQMFSVLESLLFVSDKPVTLSSFKSAFAGTNIKTKLIKKALQELQVMYADPTRGVSLEEVSGGWQLRTKLDNADFLKKLNKSRPFKLTGPALETLSIIAYKQPVIKNEVDQVRGVESGHLVRALMEKGLVRFEGKSELPGKPMMYGTTRKFLEIFGLKNIKELPTLEEIDQLLPEGIGDEEEKENLSDVTARMSEEIVDTYSQSEEELEQITEKLTNIDTSSEFFEDEKRRQKEKREKERAQDIRDALEMQEEVEEKDRRWLERYDRKLEEAVALAALQEETSASLESKESSADEMESLEVTVSSDDEMGMSEEMSLEEPALMNESSIEEVSEEPVAEGASGALENVEFQASDLDFVDDEPQPSPADQAKEGADLLAELGFDED